MSSKTKTSVYFPSYQLRPEIDGTKLGQNHVWFHHAGLYFLSKIPLLGMTETQKRVFRYLLGGKYSPVISISHEAPRKPDPSEKGWTDPECLYRHYSPYAVAVATVTFLTGGGVLGVKESRDFKVYFCDLEYHEENIERHQHSRSKTVYIQPL